MILKLKELILLLHHLNYKGLSDMLVEMFNPVELNFKSIVQAHLFEELEIREFAILTNTSLSTFRRKFKQIFNDTPARYIINKRLEKAAQLLKMTDKKVIEVCFECGFNDPSTFSKSFSKKYAKSPSEFRS